MITTERKLLLSLVDLSLFDVAKATQIVEKISFDFDNDFSNDNVRLGMRSVIALIKSGTPAIPDLIVSQAIKLGASQAEADSVRIGIKDYEGLSLGVEGFAKDVIATGDKRRLLRSLQNVQTALSNPKTTAQECLKRLTADAFRSRDARQHKKLSEITDVAIQPMANGKPTTIVVPTGIPELDRVIGGYQPTLNLLGAEPGVGKSALFTTSLDYCGRNGIKAGFCSLEDEPSFISYRLLSQDSGVNQFKLRFTKLSDSDVSLVSDAYARTRKFQENIIVVDGSDRPMSDDEISATANDLFYNHGIKILFVDHLGEIVSRSSDRHDLEVSSQLSTLRRIANRLGIPVVVAAHFRRPPSGRIIKPVLTDFANSSGAERKARVALGLTREPGADEMMIHVLKQTNGPSGMVIPVRFDGAAAMIINSEGAQKG